MEKTNGEVIKELTEYFLQQNPEIVAESLASFMVDANRWDNYEFLTENEAKSLHYRTHMHALSVQGFLNGDRTPMTVSRSNSDTNE